MYGIILISVLMLKVIKQVFICLLIEHLLLPGMILATVNIAANKMMSSISFLGACVLVGVNSKNINQ